LIAVAAAVGLAVVVVGLAVAVAVLGLLALAVCRVALADVAQATLVEFCPVVSGPGWLRPCRPPVLYALGSTPRPRCSPTGD
jgi:hypothetical protein